MGVIDMRKKKNLMRYRHNDEMVQYVNNIIMIELFVYLLLNIFVFKYLQVVISLGVLVVILSLNYFFVRHKWYTLAKFNILFVTLAQVTVTSMIWFELESGYFMYYIIIVPLSFILFEFDKPSNRNVIMGVFVTIVVLFMYSVFFPLEIERKEFSEMTINIMFVLAALGSLTAVAAFVWMYAADVHEKRLALDELANTDGLTGLLNRRRFFELAEGIYKKANNFNDSLSLLIFDIDHFKLINDTHGHPSGDEVLKDLSSVVKRVIRKKMI